MPARDRRGDTVAILGLGLVGNFAAQLAALAGCRVIGVDLSERRLDVARACGVTHALQARKSDVLQAVRELTAGTMCEVVVEATGVPDMAATAAGLAAQGGTVVLLGTPRGCFGGDAVELLNRGHLAQFIEFRINNASVNGLSS